MSDWKGGYGFGSRALGQEGLVKVDPGLGATSSIRSAGGPGLGSGFLGLDPSVQLASLHEAVEKIGLDIAEVHEALRSRFDAPERTGDDLLSEQQGLLRQFLQSASAEDLNDVAARDAFALEDVLVVALDALERANAAAEESILENGHGRRVIDRNSRHLEGQIERTGRELERLVHG